MASDCFTEQERFWDLVNKINDNDCWIWLGTVNANDYSYGMFRITREGKRSMKLAHRISWEYTNGPIPKGMLVLHKCDVPECVNPKHLFLGTSQDNLNDAYRKGRRPKLTSLGGKDGFLPFKKGE